MMINQAYRLRAAMYVTLMPHIYEYTRLPLGNRQPPNEGAKRFDATPVRNMLTVVSRLDSTKFEVRKK